MAKQITTAASDASLESFAVAQGVAANGRRAGQTYAVITMWANGRPTLSKVYADNKTHLLSVLDRMYAEVEAWTEPSAISTARAVATVVPSAAAETEYQRLLAENAALKAAAQPIAQSGTAQTRLTRIGKRS